MTGCNADKPKGHQQNVNVANERWLKMRSALMLGMAQQQFDTGDLDQCERSLNEAFSQDPKNARTILLIGRLALERGQLERASQRFTESIALDAKLSQPHYYQGIVLQRWQRFDQALDQYRQAYDLEHDNAAFLLAVTEMLVAGDKVDEAIKELEERITYFDQNAAIRGALAELHTMKKDYPGAINFYQQALVLKPDDASMLESLAGVQTLAGKNNDAIRTLERVCSDKARADRRDLQHRLAAAYFKGGRLAEAKERYVKLTQSDAGDAQAWMRLGEVAWALKDTSGTMLAANRAVALAPTNQEGYLLIGMVWQQRNRVDEAIKMFDKAAEVAPQSADPVVLRGIALERAGRKSAAAEAYAEALKRKPGDTKIEGLLAGVSTDANRDP
ncbi:MAG: tetratricopeptide repeat protein [Planctomycetota bacterium]|nr:tetratricopeptide repeat protein [Planctomycetota bacterium]